jgi:hypothetical protein
MSRIEQDDQSFGNNANAYADDASLPPQSRMMDAEQAAAIAEVSVMPENIPTTATPVPGGGGGGTRRVNEADEALLAGDVQSLDEAGVQVRSLFLEFLYKL